MARNVAIALGVALALGFVLGPQGRLVRCNRPTTGLGEAGRILWRDTCVLAYHPSEARLLPQPRIWRHGPWPAIVSRSLAPWCLAGLAAGLVSVSIGRAAATAALAVLVNYALFLWLSVAGGLTHGSDLVKDAVKILSNPAQAGSESGAYLGAQDVIGLGIGLFLALLGAALGSIRLPRAHPLEEQLAPGMGIEPWEAEREERATGAPLGAWAGIGWRLLKRDLRGAAVRLEDLGRTTLALRLYRKAGRKDEAARLCEEKGMVFSAAHALAHMGEIEAAAGVLERAGYLARAAEEYEKAGRFDDAGRCLMRLGGGRAAGDVYRRGGLYDKAAQIYFDSGDFLVAARCYAKVGEYAIAARISEEHGAFREASEYYERMRDWEAAAHCLRRAGDPEGADRMLLRGQRQATAEPTRIVDPARPRRPGQGGGKTGEG